MKLDAALYLFLVFVCLQFSWPANAGEVRGKVVSANGGEPLRQVQVSILEIKLAAITTKDGSFSLPGVAPGRYTLRATAVGYRLLTTPLVLGNEDKEISITLVPDFRRIDIVDVKGEVFHSDNPAVPSQFDLNAAELQEASTVLADDPFRSVQTLPGVSPTANNDFFGQFSVLGAPFSNVSVYVDDVLIPAPFHGIPNRNDGASLSLFSSETLQSLELMPLAFPVAEADSIGAALSLRTRDGSRTRPTFTISAGLTDSHFIAEGELGSTKKGSWLISARKSYLNWLVHRVNGGTFTDGDFEDGSARLSFDLAPKHNLSFYFLDGHTDVSDSSAVTPNDLSTGGNDFTLARLGWRYSASPHLLFDTEAAYIRQTYNERNLAGQILVTDYYGEWVGQTRASWNWGKNQVLEAGFTGRGVRDSGFSQDFSNLNPVTLKPVPSLFSPADATGRRMSGFAQQVSTVFSHRLHLMTGIRWDQLEQVDAQPMSAQVSGALQLAKRTQVQLGVGRYAQFPSFQDLARSCAFLSLPLTFTVPRELYVRSNHFTAALEEELGEYTRIRVEAFDRENRDRIGGRARRCLRSPCRPSQPALYRSFFLGNSRLFAWSSVHRAAAQRQSLIRLGRLYAGLFQNEISGVDHLDDSTIRRCRAPAERAHRRGPAPHDKSFRHVSPDAQH